MNARQTDFQALMDLCRINEEAPAFDLGQVISHCGSHGCLLGNYAIEQVRRGIVERAYDALYIGKVDCLFESAAKQFHLTVAEAQFLFCEYERQPQTDHRYVAPNDMYDATSRRQCVGFKARHAAIRRIRKLIYYKLRKREFMHEPDGRVRESARRTEGNHDFARQVLAAV